MLARVQVLARVVQLVLARVVLLVLARVVLLVLARVLMQVALVLLRAHQKDFISVEEVVGLGGRLSGLLVGCFRTME